MRARSSSLPTLLVAIAACGAAGGLVGPAPPVTPRGQGVFDERFRPAFHFTPPFGWMNDPNGMVRAGGTWHLFYQYNPYATSFGNIGWGHAVSRDLVTWQFWPVALPPEGDRLIFSGSAVVDGANTSGLCTDPECIVAVYTRNTPLAGGQNQAQALSVSNDGGRTFRPFEGNPVLDEQQADFRDPKVFWHAPSSRWIMVLALPIPRQVAIYGSPDLKAWERLSTFGPAGATGGIWECPDLFPLAVDGDPARVRWILKVDLNPGAAAGGSGGQYFVGDFDGRTFTPDRAAEAPPLWLDHGKDFYCATTWANADEGTGSRTWVAWMSDWQYASDVPTFPWRGSFTVPREIALASSPDGPRLVQRPVPALERLRGEPRAFDATTPEALASELATRPIPEAYELELTLRPGAARALGFRIGGDPGRPAAVVGYDAERQVLFVDRLADGNEPVNGEFPGRHEGPLPLVDGRVTLRVLVDRNGVEVFGDEGRTIVTDLLFPVGEGSFLAPFAEGGAPERMQGTLWPLGSIWAAPPGPEAEAGRPQTGRGG